MKTIKAFIVGVAAFICVVSANVLAADLNGYTAFYEQGIGEIPTCDQTVLVSDSGWSKITSNTGDSIFCIENGDHTLKGELSLSFAGSSGSPKWLVALDTSQKPWVFGATPPVLEHINMNAAADWWIIHGLAFNGNGENNPLIDFKDGAQNSIVDSVLGENAGVASIMFRRGADNNAIQNSVVRRNPPELESDFECVRVRGAENTRIVNNELYDCTKSVYLGAESYPEGTIIENNDLYITPEYSYEDCTGNFDVNGPCSTSKAMISMKSGGVAAAPVKIINNRLWGARPNENTVCCTAGSDGSIATISNHLHSDKVTTSGNANYVLLKNNIFMDSQEGLVWTREGPHNHAVIGNIFYDIHQFYTGEDSHALAQRRGDDVDIYHNVIVDADHWLAIQGGSSDNSLRCNAVVSGGTRVGGSNPPSSTIVDDNAFYDTPKYTVNGSDSNVVSTVALSFTKEFCFYRKLQTNPERVCIPNVLPTPASPHFNACPGAGLISRSGLYNASANAPIASDGSIVAQAGSSESGVLVATDADMGPGNDTGEVLSYVIVTEPSYGSVVIDSSRSGAFSYVPGAGYSGSDSFTFMASDGELNSNIATVTVTGNSAPPPITELLNPGFEDNDGVIPEHWAGDGWLTTNSANAATGSYAYALGGGAAVQSVTQIEQDRVFVTGGEEYEFSGWIKVKDGTTSTEKYRLLVRWYDDQNQITGSETVFAEDTDKVAIYELYSAQITAPLDAYKVEFIFQADADANNKGYVDDLSISLVEVVPEPDPTGPFRQDGNGMVSMEAENYHDSVPIAPHEWVVASAPSAGYSGNGAMEAFPDVYPDRKVDYASTSPRLDYQVEFVSTGDHYVWIRGWGPTTGADSLHAGLNGAEVSSAENINGFDASWKWRSGVINVATIGAHTINVWMRESGMIFDKIVLTNDASFVPTGVGPAESERVGSVVNLVQNADFELGDATHWTEPSAYGVLSQQNSNGGSYAYEISTSVPDWAALSQRVAVEAGQSYEFSGWLDVTAFEAGGSYRFQVRWYKYESASGADVQIGSQTTFGTTAAVTGAYFQHSVELVAPVDAEKAEIRFQSANAQGTAYVDDFGVVKVSQP